MTAPFVDGSLEDFRLRAREIRDERIEQQSARPIIRLYDGDWKYRGLCASELSASISLKLNDTGTISLVLPIDFDDERGTFLAYWILDEESRGTRNVHVRIDHSGARICGRLATATLKQDDKGDQVEVEFNEDIEELKNVHVAGNPLLPLSLLQLPKSFFMWASAKYALKLALSLNLWRLQLTNIQLPSDPLDPASWRQGLWAQSQIVVKPGKFGDDISPPAVLNSTMGSWWDMAKPICDDAELQIVTRRYFAGDPEPWAGSGTFRDGTLVVDIVDKSGWKTGTSLGGNLATGLTRVIADVTSNYVEDSYSLFTGDPVDESGYRLPGFLGTQPAHPYVVYRDGETTGISSIEFKRVAGGPCRITAGGQSMPGVNELIQAGVQYAGDALGDNISIGGYGAGSLGGALDSFLNPIYKDTVLAYMSVPLLQRAAEQGWGHYLETVASGQTQAYTAASFMDLRKRRRETDPDKAFSFTVEDASPWIIGDNGEGHWWLGDRVGCTSKYLGDRVFVSRCTELELAWDSSKPPTWTPKFGAPRAHEEPLDKLVSLASSLMSGMTAVGLTGK